MKGVPVGPKKKGGRISVEWGHGPSFLGGRDLGVI